LGQNQFHKEIKLKKSVIASVFFLSFKKLTFDRTHFKPSGWMAPKQTEQIDLLRAG